MIADEFQAWADGPVEPKLHSENKYDRSDAMSTRLPSADVTRLAELDRAIIDSILEFYGSFSQSELIERTHDETPWKEAREGVEDGAPSRRPLSQSTMKSFYAIQELQGKGVPTRPNRAGAPSTEVVREKLFSSADRWKTALDILADK